jgi:PIN domain nuclease of toxin-antitoxin system
VSAVVTDTHAVLWYVSVDLRLATHAKQAMDSATSDTEAIFVPTVCIVEAIYLIEKGRVGAHVRVQFEQAIRDPSSAFETIELNEEIAFMLRRIPRGSVPDLPDRIIAATALSLGLPRVTRDGRIRASGIETICSSTKMWVMKSRPTV